MKRIKSKLLLSLLGASLSIGIGISIDSNINNDVSPTYAAVGSYSTDVSTYYQDITARSGKPLAGQLHDLITSTHRTYTTYDDNGKNGYQKQTDRYYENGSPVNGYIYEFYSGVKWPDEWSSNAGSTIGGYNREHIWCRSHSSVWGYDGGGADMHHIRPSETRLNSARGNNPFGEIANRESHKTYAKFGDNATYALGGYVSGGTFEPLDNKKGDVARIVLYLYLHYNSYSVRSLFDGYASTNGNNGNSSYFSSTLLPLTNITANNTEEDALKMLLRWNSSDPVDDIERRRNDKVATYQGNRNPFIDNSNYANLIWGDNPIDPSSPVVNKVTINPSSLQLDLDNNKTATLEAIVDVSNGASNGVNWTSSNPNIATIDNNGLVTAKSKGSCVIKAISTFDSSKYGECHVAVTDSSSTGGGTGEITNGSHTWDLTTASYSNQSESLVTWVSDYATMESIRNGGSTAANNYLGGDVNGRTSTRFYKGNTLRITPKDGYSIDKIEFKATSDSYATALRSSTWSNATATGTGVDIVITPNNGNNVIEATLGGTVGLTTVIVHYSHYDAPKAKLSSIRLDITNVKTSFKVGDTFNYDGLVVTAIYDDSSESNVTPTNVSIPDMSNPGTKIITISYAELGISKTATYEINVITPELTYIIATVNKTYHPGDIITKDDINVKDDLGNDITNFEFANNNYKFTYDDTVEGGDVTSKTFKNAVSYSSFVTDLVVNVSRVKYAEATSINDVMNRDWTGVTGTSYSNWIKTNSSGATYTGNSAGGNDVIQLRGTEGSGIVTTKYDCSSYLSSVAVKWNAKTLSGRKLDIYGSNTPYTRPTNLYDSNKGTLLGSIAYGASTSLVINGEYKYIGLRSNSGAMYLDEIVVTYGSNESALNIANYIMINDTSNQCKTKLGIAINKLNSLSNVEKDLFNSSSDYVISTARNRLEAWARSEGKVLTYNEGVYATNANNIDRFINNADSNISLLVHLLVFSIGSVTFSTCLILRKKKKER